MSPVGFEVFIEGLISQIAYCGSEGITLTQLFEFIREYHGTLARESGKTHPEVPIKSEGDDGEDIESTLTDAELASARLAWDWLRSRPQILINGHPKRYWNFLEFDQVLALPKAAPTGGPSESSAIDPQLEAPAAKSTTAKGKGKGKGNGKGNAQVEKPKKSLAVRPRIVPSKEVVWQTLTHHGIDYKKVPPLEWACLQGIATAKHHGILQSNLRKLVDQDKRSLPKRTDSLFRKGYIVKRTVVVQKMKTSMLWLADFAPKTVDNDTFGLDLNPQALEKLAKDTKTVSWHSKWTGTNIDVAALGKTIVGVVKAFGVMRYADLRTKLGVSGKPWQMKTVAKSCQRFADLGVIKYTAACFPTTRKVFKDCLKFVRDPTDEEWQRFLATGKKTSQYSDPSRHREPKPNALALYENSGARIQNHWTPEKPLAQTVFEVIKSAGPRGASNPQVSVATVGYQHRRYLSSYLTKVAETRQPAHLTQFQVNSEMIRIGKTSAYMYRATGGQSTGGQPLLTQTAAADNPGSAYGFGEVRPKMFAPDEKNSLSALSLMAQPPRQANRKQSHVAAQLRRQEQALEEARIASMQSIAEETPAADTDTADAAPKEAAIEVVEEAVAAPPRPSLKRGADEISGDDRPPELSPGTVYKVRIGEPHSLNPQRRKRGAQSDSLVIVFKRQGDAPFVPASTPQRWSELGNDGATDNMTVELGEPSPSTPAPEVTVEEVERATPTRGRGRGRGHGRGGGRGRGRKGQTTVANGQKQFVCEKCGSSWKNSNGLQYHLTAGQNACNTNFDPSHNFNKRRPMEPVSTPPVENSSTPTTRGVRKTGATATKLRRGALRPSMRKRPADEARESEMEFRGVEVAAIPATAQVGTVIPDPDPPVQPFQIQSGLLTQRNFVQQSRMPLGNKAAPAAPFTFQGQVSPPPQPMDLDTRPISAAKPATQALPSMQLTAQAPAQHVYNGTADVEMPDKQHDVAVPDEQQDVEMSEQPDDQPVGVSQYPDVPDPNAHQAFNPENRVLTLEKTEAHPASTAPAPSQDSQGIKSFVPNYSSYEQLATNAKVRTAMVFDIVQYLLDNNNGVFPGEKAVFYAALRVYLATFPGTTPPSLKNCQTAINSLQARKLIDMHTYLLRNMQGRMETYSVLVRHGMDPSAEAVKFTARMIKEAFPGLYIPPAFSPTPEEMADLQETDPKYPKGERDARPNANGQKFRARRRQITEVEVFNAPYYNQNIAGQPVKDTLRPNHLRSHGNVGQKRQAPEDGAGAGAQSSSPKRHKSNGGHATHPENQSDSLVDPELFKTSPPQQYYPLGNINHIDSIHRPSIVEAVKHFRLLPTRGGSKMHHNARPSKSPTKIPESLGRIKNPGLNSMPTWFFKKGSYFYNLNANPNPELVSPTVKFLEPNESLEVDDGEFESDEKGTSWTPELESNDGESTGTDCDEITVVLDEEVEKPKECTFAESTTLTQVADGVWHEHSQKHFKRLDTSFTVDGYMPTRKWQLEQNIPRSIETMAKKSDLDAHTDWKDKKYALFCTLIDKVSDWELSKNGSTLLESGSVAPDFIILNITPKHGMSHMPVKARFNDQKQFTMDTLDYQELESDDDHQELLPGAFAHRKKRLGRPPGSKSQTTRTRSGKIKLKEIKTKREHTGFPQCPEDFLRQPGDRAEGLDWSSENVRLATYVAIGTLLGGTSRSVDWGLIMRIYPEQTLSQLRHYWGMLRKDRASSIVILTAKFHKKFLKAYEEEELPPLDFDDVLAYDWLKLIKWTTRLDWEEKTALPATSQALEENFTLTPVRHEDREWREAYYHPQRSVFNRFQDATSEPLAVSLDNQPKPKPSQDMMVAMAWIRSLCVTPVQEKLDEKLVQKRNGLYPHMRAVEITELVERAIEQLQRMHVISKSSRDCSNGRQWRFNTRVFEQLVKAASQEKFEQAYRYKKKLDEAFRAKGKSSVRFKADDKGMTMVLVNMQAMGRVRTVILDQKNVPMGHEPGNYETRKYPKEYMHFKMDIIPTDKYVYDDDAELVELREKILAAKPPAAGPGGAVPVWMTCHGDLNVDMWIQYLSVVVITLASRGSMRPDELVKTVKPVIMEFEAELIMDWLEGVGVLKEQIAGMARGLGEWWWTVVEVSKEGLTAPAEKDKGKGKEVEQSAAGNKPRKSLPSGRPTVTA